MISKYIDLRDKLDFSKLIAPAKAICDGKLVLFPTETVYGIGANALDSDAVSKIFKAKGRNIDNPLIVHISSIKMLDDLVLSINEIEKSLMDNFWPGPLTIILNKKDVIPSNVTCGLDTVGIRMPSNQIALKLIEYSKLPIAAPSANISGKPSGTRIEDIVAELDGKLEYIIDNGITQIGVESTVVRVIDNKVHILRPGKISKEQIENLGFYVDIDKQVLNKYDGKEKVLSPGVKYRHYAPSTKCILVYSDDNKNMVNKINSILSDNPNSLIMCKHSNFTKYNCKNKLNMGDSLEEISHNMFTLLRKVDNYNVDLVIIEGVEAKGLGLAIMNRLMRACSHNYIKC